MTHIPPRRHIDDAIEKRIVREYRDGISENALAKRHGLTRRLVYRVLVNAGVERRSSSEAERVKWAQMSEAERLRQVESAHKATRGRAPSIERLCKAAKTREQNPAPYVSEYEAALTEMLSEHGLVGVTQKAFGPYNCDIALKPVAVEVWGGYWHLHGRHLVRLEKRFRYILDAGWHILAIVVNSSRFPLDAAVADYIAAYVKRARRKPSARREYRVIWGAAEFSVAGGADDDQITIEPPFTGRRNTTTGQYETIPR